MRCAIVFTANTLHVAQANLMIESLFDPARGNFKGDLWVISTHLTKRCQQFLDSRGIRYLINPLSEMQDWPYREQIARAQPEFISGSLGIDDAFLVYRNKRMSKLIINDWVNKFGQDYDSIALADNDLYFQRDVNELFKKTAASPHSVWYWHEENKNLPGTNLWVKNFHYARFHDVSSVDFGEHEINIGFIISSPRTMRRVFTRVRALFSSTSLELFTNFKWHDQDLVRVVRGQSPEMFRLFDEGDVLHLCNGGREMVEERSAQNFYHKKTNEKPYLVHFAGGAWKPYNSVAASFKVDDDPYFFVSEQSESYDVVRRNADFDPFDRPTPLFSRHNIKTKAQARDAWMNLKATSNKKNMLFFSWLETGSHKPLRSTINDFLQNKTFDLAVIDGNVNRRNFDGLIVEDLPDLMARVTDTIKNDKFGRSFGYKRHDVPEAAISSAIAALVEEYRCPERNARAVANAAYIYLMKALAFYKPDVVVCWGAYLLLPRILTYICHAQGIPKITMEMGVLPNTLAFDCAGHMGESWVARDSKTFNALPLRESDLANARNFIARARAARFSRNVRIKTSDETNRKLEYIKRSGKKVVLYVGSNNAFSGHVPYTAASKKFHSPFFVDNNDVVKALSAAFATDENIQIVYKPHPITITRGLDIDSDHDGVTIVSDANIEECIALADLVVAQVTQGSYEALLRDKPVLMVGINQINASDAVYKLSKKTGLRAEILAALENGLTESQKASFEDHVARLLKYYLYNTPGSSGARSQKNSLVADMEALLYGDPGKHLKIEKAAIAEYRKARVEPDLDNPKISIIMPVYNGEEYLVDCIGSILSQTFVDIELICVNNGSSDGSQRIIDYFVKRDPRVKSLYQEEPNQRAARNLGVSHARGQYLHFFDCDDLFVNDAYEVLYKTAEETGADALYFFFDEIYNTQRVGDPRHLAFRNYLPRTPLFKMEEAHKRLFAQYPFPWAKLFNAKFFHENKLQFDLDCDNYDDNPQNLRTLLTSKNLYVLNKPLYKFRINMGSMTQSVNPRAMGMLDAVRLMNDIYQRFGRYDEFQPYYVPYKIHLLHFAWTRLPDDLREAYYPEIRKRILPGDEAFFAKDELFSMFSYLTQEKIDFVREALTGEYRAPVEAIEVETAPVAAIEAPQVIETTVAPALPVAVQPRRPTPPASQVSAYPNPTEERVVTYMSRKLSGTPLFGVAKRLYRTIRPLNRS